MSALSLIQKQFWEKAALDEGTEIEDQMDIEEGMDGLGGVEAETMGKISWEFRFSP